MSRHGIHKTKKEHDEWSAAKKAAISSELFDTPPSTPQASNQEESVEMQSRGGATAATQGYRGVFVGETMENPSYSEKHKEQIHITTRTAKRHQFVWASYNGAIMGEAGLFQSQNAGTDPLWLADEAIMTLPINMYAGNFVDYKLLGLLGRGSQAGYSKWKLNNIRVSIEFEHYTSSWINYYQQYAVSEDEKITLGELEANRGLYINNTVKYPAGMYVYRDKYDEFSNGVGNINVLPGPSGGQATGTVSNRPIYRIKKFIQNEVSSLSYVHPGEKFHFMREIGAKGSYFITPDQIVANFKKYSHFASPNNYSDTVDVNIQTVINQLEGIQDQQGFIGTPLREGFNLLIAPDGAPFVSVRAVGGKRMFQPNIFTTAWVKYEADWFGYDFTYGQTLPARIYSQGFDGSRANAIVESEMKRREYEDKVNQLKALTNVRAVHGMGEIQPMDSDFIKY